MSKYKKGAFLNVLNFNPTEWEAQLRQIKNLPSRQHIEVWLEYIPTKDELQILRGMLEETEVIVHGPFIHMSLVTHLNELADVSWRRCYDAVDVATLIGAKVITFHAGTYAVFETQEAAFERLVRRFSDLVALNAPVVTLENMPGRRGTTRECLGRLEDLKLLKSILPNIRFTLDIGHSLQNGEHLEPFLREQGPCIENIHLHDGEVGGRSHLPLGTGSLDLPKLLDLLWDIGYSKYMSLETISLSDTKKSWAVWLSTEKAGARDNPAKHAF